ncbi:MAG: hypothetical protein ABI977_06805 [Acidobacteriota bacterium]
MPSKTYTNEEIVSYLLDTTPKAETGGLEQAYFEDADLAAIVSETENNLIDDYVRGQLQPTERELFERHYLSHPNRRRRVENARVLITNLDLLKKQRMAGGKAFWWKHPFRLIRGGNLSLAYQAIALVLIAGGCFYLWHLNRSPITSQIPRFGNSQHDISPQISPASQDKEPSVKEIAQAQPHSSAPSLRSNDVSKIPTIRLTTGLVRRGRGTLESPSQPPIITSGNKEIRLVIKTQATDYQSYIAQIWTVEEPGQKLFTLPNKLRPSRQRDIETLVIVIPAASFRKGVFTYKLVLKGIRGSAEEPVNPIPFQIEKR